MHQRGADEIRLLAKNDLTCGVSVVGACSVRHRTEACPRFVWNRSLLSMKCTTMALLPSTSEYDLHRFHNAVARAAQVRSHFDAMVWLQGDMQHYLPHAILIAAWGNFEKGKLSHDIISPLVGVRSHNSCPDAILPMLLHMFTRWSEFGGTPFVINAGVDGFSLQDATPNSQLKDALGTMRCVLVHGMRDERGSQDCLYLAFSDIPTFSPSQRSAMAKVLPYIDASLRQVALLPHQTQPGPLTDDPKVPQQMLESSLSDREEEVLQWVALGKTNSEIGRILTISEFTIKSHLRNIFKKLNVSNRAQAVGKVTALTSYA
ncbi:XrtB/PEP-CTERM-associated transcriptional regulator EpsA [Rhodoferax sp. BLA1]|uniref:XrtB/PEP-CTERM-associated transcriptional regulator EpsA n=1 Tax=Rhodoferax sp. BLA1 TaxID=2576062 RepID=UPI0015D0FBDC|nr:XrtB/PEP-CTERM-associated transcriptional regulator EpsA [Rhodoferax sp. BLA1]